MMIEIDFSGNEIKSISNFFCTFGSERTKNAITPLPYPPFD
jgi:hypothetical protein